MKDFTKLQEEFSQKEHLLSDLLKVPYEVNKKLEEWHESCPL